jgi:ATP-dependent helicase/DNAse subunit B
LNVIVDVGNNFAATAEAILSAAANLCSFHSSSASPCLRKNNLSPMYVLVPDRFTLQAERILLSHGKTLLNARVITFSMLYNIVASELGQGKLPEVIDKATAVLYLWRAIKDVTKDLLWFSKSVSHYDFAEKMFNTINQMKSSLVKFDEMPKQAKSAVAQKKFRDINLIYNRYKEIIGTKYDSAGLLDFLIENIKKSTVLKSVSCFVCGFENFSSARLTVLGELCKSAELVHIGAAAGGEFAVQLDDMERALAEEIGLKNMKPFLRRKIKDTGNKKEFPEIFSYPVKKQNCDAVSVGVFADARVEANAICSHIVSLVNAGTQLQDITVLLADFDNTAVIWDAVLKKYNIPGNIDVGKRLSEFAISKYMRDLLELTINDNPENTVSSVFNKHSGISDAELFALENAVIKNNLYGQFKPEIETKTVQKICASLLKICGREDNEIVVQKLKSILNVIAKTFGEERIELREFINLFWTLVTSTKISDIPLYQNRIAVVSCDEWVPTAVLHLFIANCSADNFPKGQNDDDILQETDLAGTAISPTASLQRERNRRHIGVILSCVIQDIVLTSVSVNAAGEKTAMGDALQNLKKMGAKEFVSHNTNVVGGFLSYLCGQQNITCGKDLFITYPRNMERTDNQVENGTVNTTMLERFYMCPYMNFIQNGLRLCPRDIYELKPSVIGNIIHKAIREYFQGIIDKKEIVIDEAVKIAFADEEYKNYIADKKNKPIVDNLKKEIKFIINTLLENLQQGEFLPYKVEQKIQIPLNLVTLKGIADRVDAVKIGDKNYFAIYDYKTGVNSGGVAKSIYMGDKLQLPIYSLYFMEGGEIAGAGYLPVTGGYTAKRKTIRLNGFVNRDTVLLWDRNLDQKDYVSSVISADSRSGQLTDAQTVTAICQYAKGMAEIAVSQIMAGYIAPAPIDKEKCKYCPVGTICGGYENVRTCRQSVSFKDFKEIKPVKYGDGK